MKSRRVFILLLICYLLLLVPFASHLKNRPLTVKLGYTPDADVLKPMVADQRYLVAEWSVMKVLFYFGTLLEASEKNRMFVVSPEYLNMYKTLQTALKLDPYNMDAYYFAQAAFTWEVGRYKEVNSILAYGMRYRTWDYQLPFFAGFNAAYFMHDYGQAATYMKKAAELSGNPLFTNLAARFLYEAGKDELGILFLENMEKSAKDEKVKNIYGIRKKALRAVNVLKTAVAAYTKRYNRLPPDLSSLVSVGIIDKIPDDPYGGNFFLTRDGMVRSTSKFAFGEQAQ